MPIPPLPIPEYSSDFQQMSPVKKTPPGASQQQFIAHQVANSFDPNLNTFDQEPYPNTAANDNADFPSPAYNRPGHLKRSFSEMAPISDGPSKRARVDDYDLLDPKNMPPMEVLADNEENRKTKPKASYAQMIANAILRAPNQQMTLSQIYDWIAKTYPFYGPNGSAGQSWNNSIRHNLSLNKCFYKVDRPKSDPGKGHYWRVIEGSELTVLKTKNTKHEGPENQFTHTHVMQTEPMSLSSQPEEMIMSMSQPVRDMPEMTMGPYMQDSDIPPRPYTAPAQQDLCSDATIPDFDPSPIGHHADHMPANTLDSSPPTSSKGHRRSESSPSTTGAIRSSALAQPNPGIPTDSAYGSYDPPCTSSISRPKGQPHPFDGRAETAIQRMRSVSQLQSEATPSHGRQNQAFGMMPPPTSSPFRSSPPKQHPFTPARSFRPATAPPLPPSVSPISQLHKFRAQVAEQEPAVDTDQGLMVGNATWLTPGGPHSPFVGMHATNSPFAGHPGAFSPSPYWSQSMYGTDTPKINEDFFGMSPQLSVKHPVQKPMMRRNHTSTNALHEIQGNEVNKKRRAAILDTPSKKPMPKSIVTPKTRPALVGGPLGSPLEQSNGSPLKRSMSLSEDPLRSAKTKTPMVHVENEENDFSSFVDFDGGADENEDIDFDLGKGFAPIAAGLTGEAAKRAAMKRPSAARTYSSIF